MPVPVDFTLQAELDLIEFVPLADQVSLLETIIDRLGSYPEIGVRLEVPNEFARAHGVARWIVFYELVAEAPRIDVLRIVPDAFTIKPRLR